MRITTSARSHSGNCASTSAAWSASRYASTMAMICGCSWRISSATARESIHLSASRPLLERPNRMRSMTPRPCLRPARRSAPCAGTRRRRRRARSGPRRFSVNSLSTCSLPRARCSAAGSSPRRCAARPWHPCASSLRWLPLAERQQQDRGALRAAALGFMRCFLLIVADPRLHHLCHAPRILRHQLTRAARSAVVVERRRSAFSRGHRRQRSRAASALPQLRIGRGAPSRPRISGRSTGTPAPAARSSRPAASRCRAPAAAPTAGSCRAARLPAWSRHGTTH